MSHYFSTVTIEAGDIGFVTKINVEPGITTAICLINGVNDTEFYFEELELANG